MNDSQKRKPKNARPFKQDEIEHRQADVALGKEGLSCKLQIEAASAAGLNNLVTPNDSQARTEAAVAAVSDNNPEPTGDSHPQKVKSSSSYLSVEEAL